MLNQHPNPVDPAGPGNLRAVTLLLEGIVLHAIECNPQDRIDFQNALRNLCRKIEKAGTASDSVVNVGDAVQMLGSYNRGIERYLKTRVQGYEEMVGMLSTALLQISHASASAVENLDAIGKELRGISQIDDMRELKGKLAHSLQELARESKRQKCQNQALVEKLEGPVSAGEAAIAESRALETDPITGLAGHAAAERELARIISAGQSRYVAVICLKRFELIASRHGSAIGDQLLLTFSECVAEQLTGSDELFRWRGAAMLAIFGPDRTYAEVKTRMDHSATSRLEQNIVMGSHSVLLPISQAWSLFPLPDGSSADEAFAKIDAFVSGLASARA